MKLTRQGVRDLNGYRLDGRQLNQRRSRLPAPCWHEWTHCYGCPACDVSMFDDYRGPHYESCRRCGASRRV